MASFESVSRQEAIDMVLTGLQTLVLQSAGAAAGEQYSPGCNPDDSDDKIADRKEDMKFFRAMRAEFENRVTAVIDDPRGWRVQVLFADRKAGEELTERLKAEFPGAVLSYGGIW